MKRTILTDIEGTTSSLSFVKDVLFPDATRNLPAFVRSHGADPEVRRRLNAVARETGWEGKGDGVDERVVETLLAWIVEDRKHTALKALQGMIWQEGYVQGRFRAHVFEDAVQALRAWHAQGHALYVYSSGSVKAQQLYFRYSDHGDLSSLFRGYFDTEIGGKREAESYRRIVGQLGVAPATVAFLSDVVEELDAARDVGLSTVLVDRTREYPATREGARAGGHLRVTAFSGWSP